jgi:hypothetical protein
VFITSLNYIPADHTKFFIAKSNETDHVDLKVEAREIFFNEHSGLGPVSWKMLRSDLRSVCTNGKYCTRPLDHAYKNVHSLVGINSSQEQINADVPVK